MGYQARETIMCIRCGGALAVGRRLCRKCYNQVRRAGALSVYPVYGPEDVFMRRVEKTETCWLWTGTKNTYGYGIFLLPSEVQVRAHRYSYERVKGPIPQGLIIMHVCDNPSCVNPAHLRVGTKADNNRDCSDKDRRPRSTRHWNARLTDEQVRGIRADSRATAIIAKDYGVSSSHVYYIRKGVHRAKG